MGRVWVLGQVEVDTAKARHSAKTQRNAIMVVALLRPFAILRCECNIIHYRASARADDGMGPWVRVERRLIFEKEWASLADNSGLHLEENRHGTRAPHRALAGIRPREETRGTRHGRRSQSVGRRSACASRGHGVRGRARCHASASTSRRTRGRTGDGGPRQYGREP